MLASNAYAPVQAAEIRHDGGVMWGVQYHPEYSLREISVILGRRGRLLIGEGLFADEEAHARYIADLRELHDQPSPPRPRLAARAWTRTSSCRSGG